MPISRSARATAPKKSNGETVKCPRCDGDIPPGKVHCDGSKVAYGCQTDGPHHGSQLWPDCWKCHGAMGCSDCVPGGRKLQFKGEWVNAELICKRCRVKVTLESFLNGGPISRFSLSLDAKQGGYHEAQGVPGVDAYPSSWVAAYDRQCTIEGRSANYDEEPDFRLVLRMLNKIKNSRPMALPTKRQLNAERNRQHEELAQVGDAAKVKSLQ